MANSGSILENIPFIAVSNNTGNQMLELLAAFLRLFSDVDNAGELSVSVPCGTLYGKSEDLIIVGAHHDTVYHAQGAVDDTSGTASVLEMARQIAMIANESGTLETRYASAHGAEKRRPLGQQGLCRGKRQRTCKKPSFVRELGHEPC